MLSIHKFEIVQVCKVLSKQSNFIIMPNEKFSLFVKSKLKETNNPFSNSVIHVAGLKIVS